MSTELPAGVYQFDPTKEPNGPRLPGLTDSPQHMDDGSANQANQVTSQIDPWTQPQQTTEQLAQAIAQAQQPAAQAVTQEPSDIQRIMEENKRLKDVVGNQGNTIGEMRKLMGTLVQRVTQTTGATPQQAQQMVVNLFKNRAPNDYPTAEEIQTAFLTVANEFYQAINQRIEDVAVQGQLQAAGVTPEESAMIRLEYPSLSHLPADERNAVIAAVVKAKRAESNAATAATVQQATQTAQAGVRQQVYVPQPQPISNVPQSGAVINLDAFGNLTNAQQMEKALKSLGVQRVDDRFRRGL